MMQRPQILNLVFASAHTRTLQKPFQPEDLQDVNIRQQFENDANRRSSGMDAESAVFVQGMQLCFGHHMPWPFVFF